MSGTVPERKTSPDMIRHPYPARDERRCRLPLVQKFCLLACWLACYRYRYTGLVAYQFRLFEYLRPSALFAKGHATVQPFLPRELIYLFPFVVFSYSL